MDHLIPLVNKLQDVFGAIGQQPIDLPQITVVGSQSAGKSSVLEHIVGRDFLPRGTGVVTRRPLVLQLYNTGNGSEAESRNPVGGKSNGTSSGSKSANGSSNFTTPPGAGAPVSAVSSASQPSTGGSQGQQQQTTGTGGSGSGSSTKVEWGEFLHIPGQRFYDFNEIRSEIIRETERLTGKNKGLSNKTINLKIFSPYVLNLTLVDLPGITKVPTGDQPEDVEEQVRSMCMEFISNPNAIILAVTAANQDLVNSDGLKLARAVDPDGLRTIGVLTKVDIMDAGTDCADILMNHVVPLRRGYIAVINRSQKDIQENITIRQCLTKEAAYFQTHPKYRTLASTKCGTLNLTRTLNQMLVHHIRDCLPEIRTKIVAMLNEVHSNIDSLGDATDSLEGSELGKTLLRLLSHFSNKFRDIVDGHDILNSNGGSMGTDSTELYGGARIAYIFNDTFVARTLRVMDPFEGLQDVDIRTAISNANGARGPSLFVPEAAFELLVRRQIERLREPGLQCIDYVFDEIQRMAYYAESAEITRFPTLRDRVFDVVNKLLRSCVLPTQTMVNNLIEVELAHINTSHPDFVGGKQAVTQMQMSRKHGSGSGGNSAATGGPAGGPGGHNAPTASSSSGGAAASQQPQQQSTPPQAPDDAGARRALPPSSASTGPNPSLPQHQHQLPPAASSTSALPPGAMAAPADIPGGGFFGLFKPALNATGSVIGSMQQGQQQHQQQQQAPSGMTHRPPAHHGHNSSSSAAPSSSASSSSSSSSGGLVKLPSVPDRMRSSHTPTDRERVETELIKTLVASYFDIVRKNYMDLVPKSIMHFLVHTFKDKLQNELVSQLYRDEGYMHDLLQESEDVASRRKAYREMRELLGRALEILNEVRDFNTFKPHS